MKPAPPSQQSLKLSPHERFKELGRKIGMAGDPIELITDQVWNVGDYRDVKQVYKALSDMAIHDDVRSRWAGAWSSYLKSLYLSSNLSSEKAGGSRTGGVKGIRSRTRAAGRDFVVEESEPT